MVFIFLLEYSVDLRFAGFFFFEEADFCSYFELSTHDVASFAHYVQTSSTWSRWCNLLWHLISKTREAIQRLHSCVWLVDNGYGHRVALSCMCILVGWLRMRSTISVTILVTQMFIFIYICLCCRFCFMEIGLCVYVCNESLKRHTCVKTDCHFLHNIVWV